MIWWEPLGTQHNPSLSLRAVQLSQLATLQGRPQQWCLMGTHHPAGQYTVHCNLSLREQMSIFLPHFVFPCVRPWDNRSKCYMDRKRIQCLSNASQHVPIYLQPFLRYSKLLVENCNIFTPHLCLAAPQGVTPSEFREDLDTYKTRMNGLSCCEESMTFSHFDTVPACDRQTDRRPAYIYYVLQHSWRT